MMLTLWDGPYAVVRLGPDAQRPGWLPELGFVSFTRTGEETSLVCVESCVPHDERAERGWRLLKLDGPIAFSAVGVLSSLLEPLAQAKVSVFALSTFDTDYLLVKEAQLATAVEALERAGHSLR